MKLTEAEFKKLQKLWNQRLKDSGFVDIEKVVRSNILEIEQRIIDPVLVAIKQEYYSIITERVKDPETVFRDETDSYILNRYSEGARIQTIVNELQKIGTPRSRRTVRVTIRRYEIAWNIRTYNRGQLNLRKKK